MVPSRQGGIRGKDNLSRRQWRSEAFRQPEMLAGAGGGGSGGDRRRFAPAAMRSRAGMITIPSSSMASSTARSAASKFSGPFPKMRRWWWSKRSGNTASICCRASASQRPHSHHRQLERAVAGPGRPAQSQRLAAQGGQAFRHAVERRFHRPLLSGRAGDLAEGRPDPARPFACPADAEDRRCRKTRRSSARRWPTSCGATRRSWACSMKAAWACTTPSFPMNCSRPWACSRNA